MSTILDEILAHKREEVAAAKQRCSPDEMAALADASAHRPAGFEAALRTGELPRVIAEVKRRSPSKGEIRADFDPVAIAEAYTRGGAAALSVLTDERYFGGSLEILRAVRGATDVPLLRKEFVVDAYQIDEARVAGADAVLLIVKALEPEPLDELHRHALARGLDVLVEVHDEAELEVAIAVGARVIGVNNRDLTRFVTDLAVTEALAPKVPDEAVLVTESGIMGTDDVRRLLAVGARGFLVGESLMRQADVEEALCQLRGVA